ncbi:MAG: PAS domain S-box protein [Betaproteobacteria bacterium]|nr:PAS domain S-box protein [Betaproteobacteria bacterium]
MPETALLALAHNVAVLVAMGLAFHALPDDWLLRRTRPREAALGLLAGAMGAVLMLAPWQYVPGIFFDARSVLLAITGLYFGPLAAAVAAAVTASLRLWQGGPAALTGVLVIAVSAAAGVLWRRLRRRPAGPIPGLELWGFGLAVHAVMLALMFTLPPARATAVVAQIAFPVMGVFPLATALVGTLLEAWIRRARTAEALRLSEERLRLALAASHQGSFDIDLATGEATVSDEYARMLGYEPEGFRDSHQQWIERMHPEDRESALAKFDDLMAGRIAEYRGEFRLRSRTGEWLWILSVGRIVARDGGGRPTRVTGTHTDITARREAEERLREAQAEASRLLENSDSSRLALLSVVEDLRAAEDRLGRSESFYRGLFENMHEGFAFCRMLREAGRAPDFTYLRVNEAFERMLGLAGAEGGRAGEAILDLREANPQLVAACERVVDTGVPESLEAHVGRLDRWFLVSVYRPERDHFVAAFVDITERKRAELEVNRQLAELRRWYEATLDREDRLLGLKAEVNELRRRLGEPPRYASAEPGAAREPLAEEKAA